MKTISLKWFRDQGLGQKAADDLGARQERDGDWPIARLDFSFDVSAAIHWAMLMDDYNINAMTEFSA